MTDYVNLIIWHGKKRDFLTRLFNGSTRHQFAVTDIVALPLENTLRYYGAYAEAIDNLCRIVSAIPHIGEAEKAVEQAVYLHYYTEMEDYLISGYDGEDTMYGTAKSTVFPDGTVR